MNARRWLVVLFLTSVVHNVLRAAAAILKVRGPWVFNYVGRYPSNIRLDASEWAELAAVGVAMALAMALGLHFWKRQSPPTAFLHSALWAVLSGALLGLSAVAVLTLAYHSYGYILFMLLPFVVGLHAAVALSWQRRISIGDAVVVASVAILLLGAMLVAAALEGLGCLAMAVPIALPLAILGGLCGYAMQALKKPVMLLLLAGMLPSGAPVERALSPASAVLSASTSIDIAASPVKVWQTVLQPATLQPPTGLLFRAGIAYPRKSHIEGSGLSAIRYCDFSTGKLVEPVLLWEQGRRLRFTVQTNPLPMQEWTPYAHIHAPHLEGFLQSRQGEFRLEPLPGGGTRLVATTWYQHHLAPNGYWQLWSDQIIHQIHKMVLENIRERALD